MKKLLLVLCGSLVLILAPLYGEPLEWTNAQGKTIKAEFVSATHEAVTISMQGKVFVVKLADLSPQSRALAAKLRVQKSTVQKPGIVAEAPKVVVDYDKLNRRDGLGYFERKPFTGVAVSKHDNGQKKWEGNWKDGKRHGLQTGWYEDGQKKKEVTYKAGKKISEKQWDEDGNPMGQDGWYWAPKVVVDGYHLPSAMQTRLPKKRIAVLRSRGGKDWYITETAIIRGLNWLKVNQAPDGSWGGNARSGRGPLFFFFFNK